MNDQDERVAQPRSVRVAACQMVSTPRVDENLRTAERLIAQASAEGATLVGLPEYFCIMGLRDTDKVAHREPIAMDDGSAGGPIQQFLAEQARKHGIWLCGGTIPIAAPEPGKVLNTTIVFNPHGERVARYDKIHLFGFDNGSESYDESRTITAGCEPAVFDGPFGRVGLSVCYDLRFPELYRSLGVVSLLMVPAAFTATTGRAHWEVLLRARAIENQCYVLAPAQGGRHENGRSTWGHSMLIDPWGKVLAQLDDGEGVVSGLIELADLDAMRVSLPALRHRVM